MAYRVAEDFVKTINACSHCGERNIPVASKFCKNCGTAAERREMCEENNKIRKEAGLEPLVCNMCN